MYIVDDIYDTGNTVNAVIDYLMVKDPSMISIVTLLKRKSSPKLLVPNSFVDNHYNVFEIDEEWVIGYGLDNDNGHCRNYNMIYEI